MSVFSKKKEVPRIGISVAKWTGFLCHVLMGYLQHETQRKITRHLIILLTGVLLSCASIPESLSTLPVPREEPGWMKRHGELVRTLPRRNPGLLFIGDSITQAWLTEGNEIWNSCYSGQAVNLGFSADKTQHLLWRLENGELDGIQPDAVILLIGTNNQRVNRSAGIYRGVHANVRLLRKKLPHSHIVLMTIFPCREKGHPFRERIIRANRRIEKLGKDKMITVIRIWDEFLHADGRLNRKILFDGVHLTEKGYRVWARRLNLTLTKIGIDFRGCSP